MRDRPAAMHESGKAAEATAQAERRAGRWNGEAPPPALPAQVVDATSRRYLDAYRRFTGAELKIQGTG